MAEAVELATVQKRGQVTLPIEMCRTLGIEEGGIVAMIETEGGILISPW
jgi:AbrB family looped-hinge helix DNA binding protein